MIEHTTDKRKIEAIEAIERVLAIPHRVIEDGWYSCPLSEDYYGPLYGDELKCDCGKDTRDVELQKVLEYLQPDRCEEIDEQ